MGEIAGIFTLSIGPQMMIVFMVGAFAATFSTAFNYFDGWPRIVGACCRNLFPGTAALQGIATEDLTPEHRSTWYSEYNIYRITMMLLADRLGRDRGRAPAARVPRTRGLGPRVSSSRP